MSSQSLAAPTVDPDTATGITVRFFAAAKAEAGQAEAQWSITAGCTIEEAVRRFGFGDSPVFARSSFLLNGRSASRSHSLTSGDVLDVLPPFAGG
ncbi:molybdopterin synthase sulfur carrier subunit [Microbacterium sp. SORGH_AS 1204]|uniref:MoaD/ThiS family protein n=1 Tax=Microbacterium sp. SORGH_AS_1204 TaxID=3041785 RepID=UPI00278D719A|nr:MoaD/ThiS family protein [Microbacterium sp. SORGH_AS_1204]MDQ1137790.1 molybdopterin synthase sulfur carrier subunit [Microbacterium sp. SORGH_AS_1204]